MSDALRHAARQDQFLEVIDPDEAHRRFQAPLRLEPLGTEVLPLSDALDRILAATVASPVDVPPFDRSNVDGFAVQAADTFGATEDSPRMLRLLPDVLHPGSVPRSEVVAGTALTLATGAMLPRGADAVLMIEFSDLAETPSGLTLRVCRAVSPGEHITFAGTDIFLGETLFRPGTRLTSRELGVLAAIGLDRLTVYRRPRVAIVSTGNELIPPGAPLPMGGVYDSNAAILGAAVREAGGEPVPLGIVPDDEALLTAHVHSALDTCDAVVLSGGTSKGAGDLSYRVVSRLANPGIVAHGVALKPGKPICLAVERGKPVVVLPGFPTSAVFTFHEFVAPVIRLLAGRRPSPSETVSAHLPVRINSERGRTEFLLVGLIPGETGLAAYPMGKGSGSVTTFSQADGFVTIGPQTELLDAGEPVNVQLLGHGLEPADLVVIGSHCLGLDELLGSLQQRGFRVKQMNVGSTGGLAAARRGQCDIAGIHLLDPESGVYNRPFLTEGLTFVPGYGREQGLVYRADDARFAGQSFESALTHALGDANCRMVNRNAGSGTRILIDGLLAEWRPPGYAVQARSHNAVAAAIAQNRADWGLAIATVARAYGLGFIPYRPEQFDFVIPSARLARPAVQAFLQLLHSPQSRSRLAALGMTVPAAVISTSG